MGSISKSSLYNSPAALAVKLLDPTGIASYGDVYNAWTDGKFDYNDVVEPLGALPLVGKVAKLTKLGKFGEMLAKTPKMGEYLKAKEITGASKWVPHTAEITWRNRRDPMRKKGGKWINTDYSRDDVWNAEKTLRNFKKTDYVVGGLRVGSKVDDAQDLINPTRNFLEATEYERQKKLAANNKPAE